jgi:hypothetical protein
LVGNTVVQPSLVNDLQRRTDQLSSANDDLRAEVDDLRAQVGRLALSGDILSEVDSGGLAGVPVIVVTHDGVEGALLSQTRRALDDAGADTVAVLSVTDQVAAGDEATRARLADVLGLSPSTEASALQAAAADQLAARLADGASRSEDPSVTTDVLDEFLTANPPFVVSPSGSPPLSRSDLEGIGGHAQVIVVVAGHRGESVIEPDAFMVPLVEGLVRRGANVAAGESSSTEHPFVGPLRSDGAIPDGTQMVTVDDLDIPMGGAALVLGLERLLSAGEGGDYGIRSDATGPIPPLT